MRSVIALWFGLLVPATVFAESTVGDPVASRSATAKDHYERGEYEEALRLYRDALLERPDSPSLRFNVGDVLFKLEDYEGAMQEYKAALAQADTELKADTFYNLGNALFQQQQLDPAINAYKNALEAEPGNLDAKANLELAQRYLEQQQQQQQNQQEKGDEQDQQDNQVQRDGEQEQGSAEEQGTPEEQRSPEEQGKPEESQTDAAQEEQGEQESRPRARANADDADQSPGELTASKDSEMDPEEAARIMAALKDREKEMQRRRFRGTAGHGEKDW